MAEGGVAQIARGQNKIGMTVSCECADRAGNEAVQSVRAFPILDPADPQPPTVAEGAITADLNDMSDYGASCAQDSGTPIELVNSTVDSDSNAVHVIDTGIAGTHEITYK